MRKLAVFVEGYTELLFVDRLIFEIAERSQVAIQHRKILGGGSKSGKPRRLIELKAPTLTPQHILFFLIVDCGGEDLVRQRIQEEHGYLSKAGYEKIIGIRDVFPKYSRADIPKLKTGLKYGIKTGLIPVQFVLSVMELEAWFLAEYNHFPKVDSALTIEAIHKHLGFDPANDDMTTRAEPANDLAAAYAIVGKSYFKGDAQSTIDKLDFEHLYVALRDRISQLNELITAIDSFIEPSTV
jgi:hypothetical protein